MNSRKKKNRKLRDSLNLPVNHGSTRLNKNGIFHFEHSSTRPNDDKLIYSSTSFYLYKTKDPELFILGQVVSRLDWISYSGIQFKYWDLLEAQFLNNLGIYYMSVEYANNSLVVNFNLQLACSQICEYQIQRYYKKEISYNKLVLYYPVLDLLPLPLSLNLIIAVYLGANDYVYKFYT